MPVGNDVVRRSSGPSTAVTGTRATELEDAGWPTAAEATIPRYAIQSSALASASGTIRFAFFTAKSATSRSNMKMSSGSTAAAATPTLVRGGLWSVAANGDLTLIRSTTNDTAVFVATGTTYTKALDASWTPTVGARYAAGVLVVTGVAAPTLVGLAQLTGMSALTTTTLRIGGNVTAQTDLPASVLAGSLGDSGHLPYIEFT